MAISLDFFQPPGSDIPPEILEDPRFYPYFKVEPPIMQVESPALDIAFDTEQLEFSSQLRDSIAGDMWGDYIRLDSFQDHWLDVRSKKRYASTSIFPTNSSISSSDLDTEFFFP
uniref:Uncharacterized protein n=1 Tax=Salix viminalis TaxID=40686 RepID=A0A6N2N1D8_SALVM